MKLIVAGPTGFTGVEVIRQSLSIPSITSVIALARRPVPTPNNLGPDADVSKLKSVVVKDFENYTEEEKQQLAGADACIWTIGITPMKSRSMEWDQVCRICNNYTIAGLKTFVETRNTSSPHPFRFLYMSGTGATRDQTKKPMLMAQYSLMRGKVEQDVLDYVHTHKNEVDAGIVMAGMITSPGILGTIIGLGGLAPAITTTQIAAGMLDQVIKGFEKETLQNSDMLRIGNKFLKEGGKA